MKIKFKKLIPVFLVTTILLSGCGSSNYSRATADNVSYSSSKNMAFNTMMTEGASVDGGYYEETAYDSIAESAPQQNNDSTLNGAKLICDVYINMETTALDEVVEEMEKRTTDLGGYIQDVNLYNYSNSRNYNMTIRIPYTKVDTFLNGIEEFGTVSNISDSTRDVTLQYADSETRLKNLNQQHDRLLDLLDKAENLTDVIEIEARLSEVETEIDSYSLEIKNYDNLVNYSTITLSIDERDYVSANVDNSLWGRITSGLSDNLYDLKETFLDFIVWFVVHIPNIVICAIVIFIVIVVFKKIKKKPLKIFKKKNNKEENS